MFVFDTYLSNGQYINKENKGKKQGLTKYALLLIEKAKIRQPVYLLIYSALYHYLK